MEENEIGTIIVCVAVEIHRKLGPGLLESVYEVVLTHSLRARGLRVRRQVPITITYEGLTFDEGFRADMIVEDRVILELKCVERLSNVHRKQVLTYLRLTNMKLGYLLNFSTALMRDGIVRIANRVADHDIHSKKE